MLKKALLTTFATGKIQHNPSNRKEIRFRFCFRVVWIWINNARILFVQSTIIISREFLHVEWITENKCRINKTISNKRASFDWRGKKTSIRNPCAHKVVERSKRYYIYDWNRDPINKATLRITNHKIFASVGRSSLLYKVRLQFYPTDALKPKKLKVKGSFLSMCSQIQ